MYKSNSQLILGSIRFALPNCCDCFQNTFIKQKMRQIVRSKRTFKRQREQPLTLKQVEAADKMRRWARSFFPSAMSVTSTNCDASRSSETPSTSWPLWPTHSSCILRALTVGEFPRCGTGQGLEMLKLSSVRW